MIGDGTAEGIGDTIGSAGLTTRISKLFRENRDEHKLFLIWRTLTAGRTFTTAKDWTPGRSASSDSNSTDLFEKFVVKGPFRNADVIVLSFGIGEDFSKESRDNLVKDITSIAEVVARLGKHAIVCRFPNFNNLKSEGHANVRAANTALVTAIDKLASKLDDNCGTVKCSIDTTKVTNMGTDVMRWENSFFTFNSGGYRLLAREVFESVIPVAKKVEWVHWKARMTERRR